MKKEPTVTLNIPDVRPKVGDVITFGLISGEFEVVERKGNTFKFRRRPAWKQIARRIQLATDRFLKKKCAGSS